MLRHQTHKVPMAFLACAAVVALNATANAQGLDLVVDPYSGSVSIWNTSTTTAAKVDGYQITSSSGALVPASWNSLAHQGASGWQSQTLNTGEVAELNLTSSTTLPASISSSIPPAGSVKLGNVFAPSGLRDLQWGYSSPTGSGGETSVIPAPIVYAGGLQVQAITVVDGAGAVSGTHLVLLNQEITASMNFDAYQIQSTAGSLKPSGFTGYASHNVPGWQSVAPSANSLSELNLTSSSTLAPGQDQILGSAFTAGSTPDLSLQFHLTGISTATSTGTVQYQTVVAGDANGDGIVNSQDIALVSSNWLHANTLSGDVNFDGIVNSQDIALISSNWLKTLHLGGGMATGSAQLAPVPEPSSIVLLAVGLSSVLHLRYRANKAKRVLC